MPATEAQIETPPAGRLVIRIKLIPQEPPQPSLWRRLNRNALLMVGVVAVLLSSIAIGVFRSDPAPPPAAKTSVTAPAEVKPLKVEMRQQQDAAPSSVNEVIPDVPRSALDTIRGTVRVSVRVIIDKEGRVVSAAADDRGPSRYFERLALEASKQWTFTPATSEEQRIMLLRFNFTRAGATAQASPLQ